MAKICPETNDVVLYLDCLECETKGCKKQIVQVEQSEKINDNHDA